VGCRKTEIERTCSQEVIEWLTKDYIPCPHHGVIHTPFGDREINIKEEEKDDIQ